MSQIIVTSRYLKSGSKNKSKRRNYTKYIATRESVEVRDQNKKDKNLSATENQKKLLNDLLSDFPEAKKYLEYEDYEKASTSENASELISAIIERNADVIGNRQNFVGYMAMRPGAEKRGSHGLFNEKDEPIILDKVANEVANHKGNVWSHVVSLRREDAVRLGYDNSESWRQLVKRHINDIAKAQKIPLNNLKWYAAFHNTTHHPHIHLIVYSKNTKQGFLTRQGINSIRSAFANDIFHEDMQNIYQEQTLSRDEIKAVSKSEFERIIVEIHSQDFNDPQLEKLILKLQEQLKNAKGKKVYGYLPKEVKATVNKIFSKLAKNESIKKLYEKWCDLERVKYRLYTQNEKEFPSMEENKVFQPVRNMIIRTVLEMNDVFENIEIQEPIPNEFSEETDENILQEEPENISTKFYIKWSDDYKSACKFIYDKNSKLDDFKNAEILLLKESESGNLIATYDLGKLYSTEKLGKKDKEKSFEFYQKALQGFLEVEPTAQKLKPYIQYRLGKIFCYGLGTEQDYVKSFKWFKKSAEQDNKFAQFSLANQFYFGNGTEKNSEKAFKWYKKSAEQDQPYAAYSVAQMYSKGKFVEQNDELAKKYYSQAVSGFLELESKDQADDNLFYKIGVMYEKGLGTEVNIQKAVEYFQRSADNNCSSFQLGRLYLFGTEGLEKDKEKAIQWLTKSAESGNDYAQKLLDNIDEFESQMLKNTVLSLFVNLSRCIEDDYKQKYSQGRKLVDSKLRKMIALKKRELGVKEEQNQKCAQTF